MKTALLVLDLINEIVHPNGKYAHEGYFEQVTARKVLEHATLAIDKARENNILIIYVVIAFSPTYIECPIHSPILSIARNENRLLAGHWGTQIHAMLAPKTTDPLIVKHRISPFYQTSLELLLHNNGIDQLLLAGVSTEFVILAAAREGHDRDYQVVVLEDATAAISEERHRAAIELIAATAEISTVTKAFCNIEPFSSTTL